MGLKGKSVSATSMLGLACFVSMLMIPGHADEVSLPAPKFTKFVPKNNGSTDGWTTSINDITACPVGNDVHDSYAVSSYISTKPAKEVTINVTYRLSCCYDGRTFEWSIGVYAFTNRTKISAGNPSPMNHPFTPIGVLRNTSAMQGNTKVDFRSSITAHMDGKIGMFIAFRQRGICGGIRALSLSYKSCPTFAGDLMAFPLTVAPDSTTSVLRISAKCVKNSEPKTSTAANYMFCYTNGSASVKGGCHCLAGFEKFTSKSCTDCPPKSYKSSVGNIPCVKCGGNVKDGLKPRTTICECIDGFYRPFRFSSDPSVDCEEPPSAPRNVNAAKIGPEWALLQWKEPEHKGTGDISTYRISCTQCNPKEYSTARLSYNLTGLSTYTKYHVKVYSVNNVTTAISRNVANYGNITFVSGAGLPSEVRNLKFRRNDDGSVTLFWEEPGSKGGNDLRYFVVINGDKGRFVTKQEFNVPQKDETKKYTISIKSHTSAGFSKEELIAFEIQGTGKGVSLTLASSVGASLAVVLLIAIILAIYFYRRRHPKHLQPVRLENGEVILPSGSGVQVYIDPTTYQDLEDAVQQFANELERRWIQLDRLIGGGEFGDVYKGTLRRPAEKEKLVAIKTLKSNANKKARDDFLGEAAYMGQFNDQNVITLEGVVVKDRPILIVIEFMNNGSLDSFLQDNDGKFTALQMLGMARGVSSGMTYLSEMSYIHRDLAARNILVNEDMVCKVADFGMSRELSEEETYNTTGGKIPVRWTAPEAIQFKKFTIASDVWSYGIVLWEIMSYGERPYWDWGNYEVLERLASGYRLPPPMNCPKVVHDLMLSCWHKDRVKRPKFRNIRDTIDKWIRSPELLKQEASVVTRRDTNLDYASMKTLKEWLDSIGLSRYIENFTEKGLVTPRQILDLTEPDLKKIGIEAVGHRNKIIKSINATKGQLIRTKSMAI